MSAPYRLAEALELLKQRQSKPKNDSKSDHVFDILGIVRNIVRSTPSDRVRTCQIWLVDESSANCGLRFVLYQSSEMDRMARENIQTGDILRFNRVALKSFRGSSQFQFSFEDPEPGLSWFRLGSVHDLRKENDNREDWIPKSMMTSRVRIVELVDWYKTQRPSWKPPVAPSALPTRKRRLDEITLGLLSHLEVQVTSVRSEPATRRNTWGEAKPQKGRPPVAFASVMDDSGVVMSFIDSSGRFLSKLNLARKRSHTAKISMTNVSAEHQSNLRGFVTTSNEILLVPTETTTMRIMVTEKKVSNHFDTQESSLDDIDTEEMVVRAGIADISINGLSLRKNYSLFSSTCEFLKTIKGNNGKIQKAIIYLESNNEDIGTDGVPATPFVMKSLCGSLEINELSSNEKLCSISMKLLRDLLRTEIIMEWTLRKDKCNHLEIIEATVHHA